MKPSEKFVDLYNAVVDMEEGQDKADLLALFHEAERLYLRVEAFDEVVEKLKQTNSRYVEQFIEHKEWVRRQMSILEAIFDAREKERERLRVIK